MKIALKKASEDDWNIIVGIEKSQANNKGYAYLPTIKDAKRYLGASVVYLIYVNNTLAGHIMYFIDDKKRAELTGFIILPEFQNKGVGTHVLGQVLDKILENDVKHIELVVHPANAPALIMYIKQGFKVKGWLNNPFGDGEPRLSLKKC